LNSVGRPRRFSFPSRTPAAPACWNPAALPPPLLRERQQVLPPAAIDALGDMLRFSSLEEPYAGLAQVREPCDRRSLGEFAWALPFWSASRRLIG
jgi:hypothetical protein